MKITEKKYQVWSECKLLYNFKDVEAIDLSDSLSTWTYLKTIKQHSFTLNIYKNNYNSRFVELTTGNNKSFYKLV